VIRGLLLAANGEKQCIGERVLLGMDARVAKPPSCTGNRVSDGGGAWDWRIYVGGDGGKKNQGLKPAGAAARARA